METKLANSLAEFVIQRYDQWKQNRSTLQLKWTNNWNAYRAISTGKWKAEEGEGWRSNSFINYTKQKITAGFALVTDMMLMGGKIPFMLKPSPWDKVKMADMPEEEQEGMRESIADMEQLINQQNLDCSADRKFLKNILSCALFGETYAKWVVHEVVRRGYRQSNTNAAAGVEDMSRIPAELSTFEPFAESHNSPGWEYVSVWDMFRDLESDDMKEGAGALHRQLTSPHWLKGKKGQPYFLDAAIDKVLAQVGKSSSTSPDSNVPEPDINTLPPGLRDVKFRQNTILYLELWGLVPRNVAEEFETTNNLAKTPPAVGVKPGDDDENDEIEVMVCVANDEVVRYVRTTAEERPFMRSVWEECLDEIGGTGVADNAENMQIVLNGAVRAFEDNKKLSANVQGFIKRSALNTDVQTAKPGRLYDVAEECDDARKAWSPMVTPDVGETLLSLIALAEKYLDMETMIPKITQGINTEKGRETAYEISQQVEKSGKYIGVVVRNQDEGLIEPMIERNYDYNMADPNVTKGKGNYIVKATGFNSYQDRLKRVKNLQQYLSVVMEIPALQEDTNFKRITEDIGKALGLDTDDYYKSEAEKQEDLAMMPPAEGAGPGGGPAGPGAAPAGAPEVDPASMQAGMDLELEEKQAKIGKTQAEAESKLADIRVKDEKMVIERAKAVHEMSKAAPITS